MNETSSTETTQDFPGLRVAVRLGLALLVGLGAVLAMVWRDNTRRASLEVIVASSAVGDTHYLRLPENLPEPPVAVATMRGRKLFPVSARRHEKIEAELLRVARDEATGLTIYQAEPKAKDEGERDSTPTYFLKTGPGEFLKVRPADSEK
jgi:hypothetical protein